ncbi:MAG TPA: SLBB domain-containing protein [Coleofasciculaceae cyanobacterium]|jgi:polysaccharide export outer membrane protein
MKPIFNTLLCALLLVLSSGLTTLASEPALHPLHEHAAAEPASGKQPADTPAPALPALPEPAHESSEGQKTTSTQPAETPEPMNPAASAPALLRGTVFDSNYIIGAGDALYLEDANMGELVKEGHVLSDGSINLPLVGKTYLSGLSIAQAKKHLTQKYAKYYQDPRITLQVTNQRPVRIYVMGAVANPGIYVSGKDMAPENLSRIQLGDFDTHYWYYRLYLADALLLSGGMNYNANVRDIRIRRSFPQPMTIHVNLMDLFANDNTIHDITLRDQDVIEVDTLPDNALIMDDQWEEFARNNINHGVFKVSVLGAVTKPGVLELKNRDNVLTAIAKAGGFSDMAARERIYILRTTTSGQVVKKELNLKDRALIGNKPFATWASLLPNDVIFVDESKGKQAAQYGMNLLNRTSSSALFPYFNHLFNR